jgi:hypothetical protein
MPWHRHLWTLGEGIYKWEPTKEFGDKGFNFYLRLDFPIPGNGVTFFS